MSTLSQLVQRCSTSHQPFPDQYGNVLHHVYPSLKGMAVLYFTFFLPQLVQWSITSRPPFPNWYGSVPY